MSKVKRSDTETSTSAKAPRSTEAGAVVQAKIDEENAQGFRGTEVDPTPNEHYTVKGVTSGKPTPETDSEAAGTARNSTNYGLSGIEAVQRDKESFASHAAHTRKIKRGKS